MHACKSSGGQITMLEDIGDGQIRWMLVVFAAWAAIVIGLVLYYLYSILSPGKNTSWGSGGAGEMAGQFSKVTTSTTSTTRAVTTSSAKILDGCPVVFGSKPTKDVAKSDAACFELGEHSDVTKTLTFRPRYIRVAEGYTLLAYADVFFGEPLIYNMRGPNDMVIDNDAAVKMIKSMIVRLNVWPSSRSTMPVACRVGLTLNDGSEACFGDGSHSSLSADAARPVRAVVQRGYKMQAFSGPDLTGTPVADLVGPRTYEEPASSVASSSRATDDKMWKSLSIRPCGATMYSEPDAGGDSVCTRSDVADLGTFVPKSWYLHQGCDMRAYDQTGFMGRMTFSASGPSDGNMDKEQEGSAWKSVRVVCTNIDDYSRRDASRVIGDHRNATEPCVTVYDGDPRVAGAHKSTNLPLGSYDDILKTIPFQPKAISVPFGMRFVVLNNYSETVMTVTGQTVRTDIPSTSNWKSAIVSTVPV